MNKISQEKKKKKKKGAEYLVDFERFFKFLA